MAPRQEDAAEDDRRATGETLKVLAHEMRQPLAAVFALADLARNRPHVPPDVRRYLDQIIEQAEEMSAVATSVLDGSSGGAAAGTGPVDVDEVVDSVLAGFARTWGGTLCRRGARTGAQVIGDRVVVRRCLVNVVDNAVRAAGPAGVVAVTVQPGTDSVRVLVEDDGPGFGHVPTRTGLGLRLTRRELETLGGSLTTGLRSRGGGGGVALTLPSWPACGGSRDQVG